MSGRDKDAVVLGMFGGVALMLMLCVAYVLGSIS